LGVAALPLGKKAFGKVPINIVINININCANFMGLTVNILWQFYGSYCTNIVTILWVLLYIYCANFMGLTVHILWQFYGSYCTYIVTILWVLLYTYCDKFMGLTIYCDNYMSLNAQILWQFYEKKIILKEL